MSKPYHSFKKSQTTETNTSHIHDEIYFNHVEKTNKEYKRKLKVSIDRHTCKYENELGKSYQRADTDLLLLLNCEDTGHQYIKKVSEKTRNVFYNDLYIEFISAFKYNSQTNKYEINAPGWGLKNEEFSPDCLSMLFLNKKEKTYYNLFISQYKKLKQSLFNEAFYQNIENGKIEEWLNKIIENHPDKGKKGFKYSIVGKNNNHVKDVIFAQNKGYITVGFTFPMDHIKSLVSVAEYRGTIVDQNTNNIVY